MQITDIFNKRKEYLDNALIVFTHMSYHVGNEFTHFKIGITEVAYITMFSSLSHEDKELVRKFLEENTTEQTKDKIELLCKSLK